MTRKGVVDFEKHFLKSKNMNKFAVVSVLLVALVGFIAAGIFHKLLVTLFRILKKQLAACRIPFCYFGVNKCAGSFECVNFLLLMTIINK